jgi:hypothetical protein
MCSTVFSHFSSTKWSSGQHCINFTLCHQLESKLQSKYGAFWHPSCCSRASRAYFIALSKLLTQCFRQGNVSMSLKQLANPSERSHRPMLLPHREKYVPTRTPHRPYSSRLSAFKHTSISSRNLLMSLMLRFLCAAPAFSRTCLHACITACKAQGLICGLPNRCQHETKTRVKSAVSSY